MSIIKKIVSIIKNYLHIYIKKQYLCGMKRTFKIVVSILVIAIAITIAMWIFGISALYLYKFIDIIA